jgi:amino acid transporter
VGAGIVLVFAAVNVLGPSLVGRAETIIIAVEALILVGFVAVGAAHADPARLTQAPPSSAVGLLTAAGLLYVTYQGFGVVTNAAGQMRQPRTELPRAMFVALAVVAAIYLVVSSIVVMVLPMTDIVADSGHVLADAGEAVAGRAGFVVIATAALLATASAVNATIFAAASVGADVARSHQLPAVLGRTVGRRVPVALLASSAVVVALVLFFPLSAVGQMTSLAFLVVYAAVSAGHLRVRSQTGARAWPLATAMVVNVALFAALLVDTVRSGPPATWVVLLGALVGSVVFSAGYARRTGQAPKRRSRSA